MTDLMLRTRPLRAVGPEADLWVDRPGDRRRLRQAAALGFNALLLGDPGAGATSFLNHLADDLVEDEGFVPVVLSARRAETPEDVLSAVATRLEQTAATPLPRSLATDEVDAAYQRLVVAAGAVTAKVIVLVDDMRGGLGHAVFGRLRDELWSIDLQWLVAAHTDEEGVLLTPPADAFFEMVHHLEPMSLEQIVAVLARRDRGDQLSRSVRALIAKNCGGNPSIALRLARQALESPEPELAVDRGTIIDVIERRLGRPAARLADELARSGPAGPSDPDMLRRLGWSRPRAYQVFSQLEDAGFVTASTERSGRPGRPRRMYRLTGVA